MPNRVSLINNNTVYLTLEGDQTDMIFSAMISKAEGLVQHLVAEGKPVNVLVGIERMGKLTLAVRQMAARNLRDWPMNRVAIFGANTYLRHLARLVIMATGNRYAKIFDTEAEARAWLKP